MRGKYLRGEGCGPPDPSPTPAVDIMGLRQLLGVTSHFGLQKGNGITIIVIIIIIIIIFVIISQVVL